MKICAAQTRPVKGNLQKNIKSHKHFIEVASLQGADIIIFPELSLTGYEPRLAKELAISPQDKSLDDFQRLSDQHQITIGTGMPTKEGAGIYISMLVFQPGKPRQLYSKQQLHNDELPYFINGKGQLLLNIEGVVLAPAICYESLLPEHAQQAYRKGARIYLASVAKPANGVAKAYRHYPSIAEEYSMVVLMSNCVGPSDGFESAGGSSVWNNKGELIGQLNATDEGMIIFDTFANRSVKIPVSHDR